jgi:4-amino-4-deoxy-L-arabinose transferase-like glycosyltransferase
LLCLLSLALFFYGLDLGELYRTESLRAIIGRNMVESGNWIVPTLYGEPYLTKPPGMYAGIAASGWVFGEVNEWTARLPSALAATALVFLFYWYVSRQLGRFAGFIVASITPCGFLWLDKAGAAEIDMLQVAWTGAALLFFFRAVEAAERPPRPVAPSPARPRVFIWWLAALLCVTGGGLTKWTTPAFFYATAIPFLIWRRQLRLLFCWQHLVSAAIGAGLCVAWIAAVIHQVGFDVLFDTVYREAAPRLSHEHHLNKGYVQLLETVRHPFVLLAANLPWSAFALLTLWPGFLCLWDERGRRLVQAFHCWAWPNVLVWTVLPDHATRHSFPLFPGIVALGAMVWVAFLTGRLPERLARWHSLAGCLCLGAFGLVALGGAVAGFITLPSSTWWLVLVFAGMSAWCVVEGLRAYRAGRLGNFLMCGVLTWVVLKFAFVYLYIPARNHPREPRAKAALLAQHVPAGETLYVLLLKDEGIMFYYNRPVLRVKGFEQLPQRPEPVYCLVIEPEWRDIKARADWDITLEVHLKDDQGDPMVLLGLQRGLPAVRTAGRFDSWPSACRIERPGLTCSLPLPAPRFPSMPRSSVSPS